MSVQPGYDELAAAYDAAFPAGYATAVERHAVGLFVDAEPARAGMVARFSLMHVEPGTVPESLTRWVSRLHVGAHVLVAFQCSDGQRFAECHLASRLSEAARGLH